MENTDILGVEVAVGDTVIFAKGMHKKLYKGEVVKLCDKTVKVLRNVTYKSGRTSETEGYHKYNEVVVVKIGEVSNVN